MCTCRASHMHVETHWAQEKDITTKNGASHPTTTHTLQELPTPPPPHWFGYPECIHVCSWGGGWWFGKRWQSANSEPTKYLCLHNAQGQTLLAICSELLGESGSVVTMFYSSQRKKKRWKVYFHDKLGIDSRVLSQCTGGWFI